MIERLSSERLPAPQFRYCPLVKAGPFFETAGMIALDPASGQLEPGGAGAEAARILSNLTLALPDFGLGLEHMVAANIFTTDFDRFPDINVAWEAVFAADGPLPVRTAMGVARLPLDATVEMNFRFYRED